MKMPPAPQGSKGSFGIPPEAQEDYARQKDIADRAADDSKPKVAESSAVIEDGLETFLEKKQTDVDVDTKEEINRVISGFDPIDTLKKIGIEVKPEDFHNIMFRGCVEKEVVIARNPMNGQELKAKIKTLIADEFDMVDELMAADIDRLKITNAGADVRRTTWVLAFSVLELNGKQICVPIVDDQKKTKLKETATKRREILSKLNPFILNKMAEVQGIMSTAFTFMMTNPEYKIVKK